MSRTNEIIFRFEIVHQSECLFEGKYLEQYLHTTPELGQVQESDFFSHTIHDDMDNIVQDIRQAHVTDRTTADLQPTFTEVKEKFDRAMQLGSNEERVIHEFCDQM